MYLGDVAGSKIILIRHGQSLANANKSYYNTPDCANVLTQKGVDQCLEVMYKLANMMPDDFYGIHTKVITSEYQRAKITAEICTAKIKLFSPIIQDQRLNEVRYFSTNIPAEPECEVRQRVLSLIEEHPFNLVLFCHGHLMECIDPIKGSARNCEIRTYERFDLIKSLKELNVKIIH